MREIIGFLFNEAIYRPIVNLLIVFYKPLVALGVPGALGFAIVLLTAAIRLFLYPLNLTQLRSARKMQQLKPKLDKLIKKHKDKKKLQQEQLKLYQQHGINPASGCLPSLLQFPVIIGLYRVFLNILGNGNLEQLATEINKILYVSVLKIKNLDTDFFGINLGVKPSDWRTYGIWLLLVPLLTAALSYYQTRMMAPGKVQGSRFEAQGKKKKNKEKKEKDDDFGTIMQTQMKYMFPLMIGWISFAFPLGLTLYWNTFTAFGILQQLHVRSEAAE